MSHAPSFKFATITKRKYPESVLQKAVIQHLKFLQKPNVLYFSIVNEGKRGVVNGQHLKEMGMLAGAADLCIIVNGKAHMLELKAKGQKQTESQKLFEINCNKIGVPYAVADDIDMAKKALYSFGAIKQVG